MDNKQPYLAYANYNGNICTKFDTYNPICKTCPVRGDKIINKLQQQVKELQAKEQECKNLEEEIRRCRIGIKNISIENTEICKISEKYKQALDKIEKLIPKFDTSTECDYGDFDCENCSSLDEEIVCGYKLKKIIKGIINKVKEK